MMKTAWKTLQTLLVPFKLLHKAVTFVTNFALLLFLYLFGIGVVSVLGKLFKTTFLPMKEETASYWKENKVSTRREEAYRRMF